MTIEMETLTDFPNGRVVAVEISPLKAPTTIVGNLDPSQDDAMRAAADLRRRIAERFGRNLDCSARYVREDHNR